MARSSILTIASLKRMLADRQSQLTKLHTQHSKLSKQLMAVERQIEKIGGGVGGKITSGGRARNSKSLVQALTEVLEKSGKPMGVSEILEAVEAGGYHSSSDNFRGIVNQTLIKERKLFSNVSRGVYQLKK